MAMLAWGIKVSPAFRTRVIEISRSLGMPDDSGANWLMACMAFESAESFDPAIKNMAGSGATGLIQFMPRTARGLGTTTAELAAMTAEEQLEFVYRYFLPYKQRLGALSDVYMAILWPRAIGKPESHVLWNAVTRPTTYRQNAGLDANTDKLITKGEASAKVAQMLVRGMLPEHIA